MLQNDRISTVSLRDNFFFFFLKRGRGGCSGVWNCRATTQLIAVVNANWLLGLLFSNVLKCVSSHLTWELWEVTWTHKWFYFISCNSSNDLNLLIRNTTLVWLCEVWKEGKFWDSQNNSLNSLLMITLTPLLFKNIPSFYGEVTDYYYYISELFPLNFPRS